MSGSIHSCAATADQEVVAMYASVPTVMPSMRQMQAYLSDFAERAHSYSPPTKSPFLNHDTDTATDTAIRRLTRQSNLSRRSVRRRDDRGVGGWASGNPPDTG